MGSDTIGERAHSAREHPFWRVRRRRRFRWSLGPKSVVLAMRQPQPPLSNLRSAVGAIAFSKPGFNPADFVSQYLTWRELVHTNYFNVERTRMLIAHAIVQSKGFRPTTALLEDADYPKIVRWYEQLMVPGGLEDSTPVTSAQST